MRDKRATHWVTYPVLAMALLLGIDLGTSYFKVGLFDSAGVRKGLGRVAVEKLKPGPNRCELPVEHFWTLLRQGLAGALAEARGRPDDIVGLSYASQANTFLLVDGAGGAITPLISWTDTRGGEPAEPLLALCRRPEFAATVGFEALAPESAVNKWLWFRRHEPALVARARWLMTISDYLTFALTGEVAGDASTAALLGAYDLGGRTWWGAALAAFSLEPRQLVTPLAPGTPCGRTLPRATSLLGLPAGIPFAVGGLDHHVAAIGSGLGALAEVSISMGTVLAATSLVDRVEPQPGCFHGPHVEGARFYRLAFDPAGTGQLDEFRARFAPRRTIEELLELAAATDPATRLDGGETCRDEATIGPEVRALLEKIGRAQRDLVSRVTNGRVATTVAATGGGARSARWLQIQADILDRRIVTIAGDEPACLGAAAFAAAAAGIHPGIDAAVRSMVRPGQTFEPASRR